MYKNSKTAILIFGLTLILSVVTIVMYHKSSTKGVNLVVEVPSNWSKDYVENEDYYNEYNATVVNWSTVTPSSDQVFTYSAEATGTSFIVEETATSSMTSKDKEIITLGENEAWSLISNGIFNSYPKTSFAVNKSDLIKIRETNTETITVRCWYWSNPNDVTDLSKTTVTKTFAVNSAIADLFKHIFEDIYNHPSKPVINIGDKGMGTWVLRGKNHNPNRTMSSHSLGVAIDINPSTGSFYVNNTWYGNAYNQKKMPRSMWTSLPEVQSKYHVLYDGCPIVEIFKSYGFYWGGDWTSGTDCMHLSFIGDGESSRAVGLSNYLSRN